MADLWVAVREQSTRLPCPPEQPVRLDAAGPHGAVEEEHAGAEAEVVVEAGSLGGVPRALQVGAFS
jgi:hypothetical protein